MLGAVYFALSELGVFLEGTLLKPQMIMAGVDAPEKKVPYVVAVDHVAASVLCRAENQGRWQQEERERRTAADT